MKKKIPLKGMLMGAIMATMATACVSSNKMVSETSPGAIKAVDLLGAWVGAGAPNGAFSYKDMSGNATDANFNGDILPLFTKDGIWGADTAACSSCHTGNTEDSLHEMDLTSYEGMMKGGDVLSDPPGVPLFGQSKVGATDYNWDHSKLRGRLRNNRMPPGVEFDITEENRDGPTGKEVGLIEAWVKAGAKNDATFSGTILPLLTTDGVWGADTPACTSCHFANSEESYHEMDLSSYEGVMKGADALSSPPGVGIFGQSKIGATDFDWGHSKMKERLRNNRMPPSIEFDITEENRDGPIVAHGM